ncbi:Uncharacterised protein [Staphylococcus aureus]|uniref:hypothetical protein n=1 Tax=Staphylococcus aureus TaxID=1280 RepID=UPI00092355D5|nr:hypothetical protein [Staphylococcus aureus]SGU98980.1 Uncharacterised protein [Staphylococcus aureus]
MITLSKGIEAGDWLTFGGTIIGAFLGALIAGGIAVYVAYLQNKQQNEYNEKQNHLDKNIKEYELIYQYITKLIEDLNTKHDELIMSLNNLTLELNELKQYKYLLNITYYIGDLNNNSKKTFEALKLIMNEKNYNTSLQDVGNYMTRLKNTREFINKELKGKITKDNVETLIEKINQIGGAKNIFVENLYKSLTDEINDIYKK